MIDDSFQGFLPRQSSCLFLNMLRNGLYFLVDLTEILFDIGLMSSYRAENLCFKLINASVTRG